MLGVVVVTCGQFEREWDNWIRGLAVLIFFLYFYIIFATQFFFFFFFLQGYGFRPKSVEKFENGFIELDWVFVSYHSLFKKKSPFAKLLGNFKPFYS